MPTVKKQITYNDKKYSIDECVSLEKKYVEIFGYQYIPKEYVVLDYKGNYIPKHYAYPVIVDVKDKHLVIEYYFLDKYIDDEFPTIRINEEVNIEGLEYFTNFKSDIDNHCNITGNHCYILNYDVALKMGLVDDYISGSLVSSIMLKKLETTPREFADYQKFEFPPKLIKNVCNKMESIKYGIKSPSFIKMEGKKYTFGE